MTQQPMWPETESNHVPTSTCSYGCHGAVKSTTMGSAPKDQRTNQHPVICIWTLNLCHFEVSKSGGTPKSS